MATEGLEKLTAVKSDQAVPTAAQGDIPLLGWASLFSLQSLEILGKLNPVTATGGFCWEIGSLYVEVWSLLSALSCTVYLPAPLSGGWKE